MNFRAKSIIKKVALVLAGVTAITVAVFGVKAIVDYTKDDLKTITPTFEVGNLGSDGKYVADESTLYTKEAFGCYGLQVKPDFDSTVNYQIYYYDILDNFVSSSKVLSNGFSAEAPINGAYARLVIEPRDDEDGKISVIERVKYPSQLNIKVKKEQNIENRFGVFAGRVYSEVLDCNNLVFTKGLVFNPVTLQWDTLSTAAVTSSTVLKVEKGMTLNIDRSVLGEGFDDLAVNLYCFNGLPSSETYRITQYLSNGTTHTFNNDTKYVFISFISYKPGFSWEDSLVSKLPSCLTITKT